MTIAEMAAFLSEPAAQVGLIIAIAEAVKRLGLENRWIPILDVLLGLTSGVFIYGLSLGYGVATGALIGLALGLSACGLFSGVKNTIGK